MKLEIGYNHEIEVRRESFNTSSQEQISVLFISDLHFNSFGRHISDRIIHLVKELNPTIVLLGGDYIDTKGGWIYLSNLFNSLSFRENVFAIAGNHDYFFGIEKIKNLAIENKISWIENSCEKILIRDRAIQIAGNAPDLFSDSADLNILCLHVPIDFKLVKDKFDLAFAGHLHGCQFVLWETEDGLYPGRLFYKQNYLNVKSAQSHYFISKGLGDTLPIRYNCKRDIVLVNIGRNTNF